MPTIRIRIPAAPRPGTALDGPVRGFGAEDYDGAEARPITRPLIDKLVLETDGARYLTDWAMPHFYFHVVTAYDILRHNGVDIGKRDYLSHVGQFIHERG